MRVVVLVCLLVLLLAFLGGCAQDTPVVETPQNDGLAGDGEAQLATAKLPPSQEPPGQPIAQAEPVALLRGPMPTGVAVSHTGRTFVNFPRWGDPVEFSVAEIRDGRAFAFPQSSSLTEFDKDRPRDSLISVQSVVIDPADRLWILDTGSVNFGPVVPGGAKLIGVDLRTDQIVKKIVFPPDVVLPTTYLNDVRFDLSRGKEGMAFITDSSGNGPNGIIVVDLASGRSWRKLHDHPSTKAEPDFVPIVEGEPLTIRPPDGQEQYLRIGADGIAISPREGKLYYSPLAGRHLYSVSLDALADENLPPPQVAAAVQDLGDRGFASDGLLMDSEDRLYLTDYEHNAIRRRFQTGAYQLLAQDPRMIWPDSMSLGADGYLYFTANQLNRQPRFHRGRDLREQPYALFRVHVNALPRMFRATTPATAPGDGG